MSGFPAEEHGNHGKYRVIAELGQGGTANVYLAVARGPSGFNKLVVLKFLKAELAVEPEFRRMFLNEARLAARLNHPNVVQTNEVFEEDGRPIIVMEYLEGAALSRIVSRAREQGQPIPMAMHLRVICDVLSGLHYSHELRDYDGTPLGVVHRDMTPQNVFVSFDGKVTLLDFGIAKLTGAIAETQTGVLKGKLRYMPPEQIMGEVVDRRTDIFAVGVMMWEAVTREKMWRGLADATVMHNIVNGVIPTPRSVRSDVPQRLEQICMKALATNPNGRYATAAELQLDIEEWLSGNTVTNRTIGQFVSAVFGDVRARTRDLIERQLAQVEKHEAQPSQADEAGRLPNLTQQAYSQTSRSDRPLPRGRSSWKRAVFWFSLPLILAFVGFYARRAWKRPSIAVVAPAAPAMETRTLPATEPTPPAAEPKASLSPSAARVELKLSALPEHAKLYLDDQPLASNPFKAVIPADHESHAIRAEAPGYASEKKVITFDKDVDLALRLGWAKPAGARPAKAPAAAAGAATAPAASAAPQVSCDPPYLIDENGIRHLRPECLSSK
jgi:eukaryotic-like serine/threonine-protein kinase